MSPSFLSFCPYRYFHYCPPFFPTIVIISCFFASDFILFMSLTHYFLSHSFLFVSQSSSPIHCRFRHCSTFLLLSYPLFVVPSSSVYYPHFLFPHSPHSFALLSRTICQQPLPWFKKLCSQRLGPPPLTDLWKNSILLLLPKFTFCLSVCLCVRFLSRSHLLHTGWSVKEVTEISNKSCMFCYNVQRGDVWSFLL